MSIYLVGASGQAAIAPCAAAEHLKTASMKAGSYKLLPRKPRGILDETATSERPVGVKAQIPDLLVGFQMPY